MGCGCMNNKGNGGVKREVRPTLNTSRRIVSTTPTTVSDAVTPPILDQDRLRIERLRREAFRRSLGR
jgi:hypothetical protein